VSHFANLSHRYVTQQILISELVKVRAGNNCGWNGIGKKEEESRPRGTQLRLYEDPGHACGSRTGSSGFGPAGNL